MTSPIHGLVVNLTAGLTVPVRGLLVWGLLSGSLLAMPAIAQTTESPPSTPQSPAAAPAKLPPSELNKWPPTAEQPVSLVLQLSERQLHVYRGETIETTFPVAVGKTGWETPTGTFEVIYMLEHPGWTNPFTGELMPPGPENPLGERWISFWTDGQNEIGFHGTPNRGSIGQAASHGCVRLYNEHIRELYDMVGPGTQVTVLP
ncbi:L,D-transpeptidase [Leptothoe sp. PORK10 BA2]|uniref:L,D-transpeptidase n=1 Tax=Leptothoe sp. PORK10 BA2 TaxID=3110254 RepID=UPI002B21F9FD|nr:L,D-transpeptidase [Leptothoe sp. PORK10 BA2]MEA5466779.1 L,D-transpeptidase [Leptothoe sp. PORK10 BA2]